MKKPAKKTGVNMFDTFRSISFFLEFTPTVVAIIAVLSPATAAISLLEFSTLLTITAAITAILLTICFYVRRIGKCKLTIGDGCQFILNGIIMYHFFVPVVIRQLHVISNGICKTCAFF